MSFLPFHRGELAAQAHAGVATGVAPIRDFMPDQHRAFFALLPMLPLATLDEAGAPMATILTGSPGFIASPNRTSLLVDARPAADDPAAGLLRPGARLGMLGIDLTTRRRNRANGVLRGRPAGLLDIAVEESFGNCPQYIQLRRPVALEARPARSPEGMIERADTLFVASSGGAAGGVDMSHRGGRPGFLHYGNDRLVVPDFPGNRFFNTLGNFLEDPRAAVLVPDFQTGALLHLAGRVEILWDAAGLVERAERAWVLHVERAWQREAALPLGWELLEYSPTSLRSGVFS